jgi:D-ala D-ala ligase C-terminus
MSVRHDVNTQPGMIETSPVPELAAYAGVTFDELVQWMVEDASLGRKDRRGPNLIRIRNPPEGRRALAPVLQNLSSVLRLFLFLTTSIAPATWL